MASSSRLLEIAKVFLKLGTISVGGPAAHIALMDDEFVVRRGWLSREAFLDLIGLTNLIPGPNSTEVAISLGFIRGGWGGWLIAGVAFILPATLITAVCAWLYVQTGVLPQAARWWFGIYPATIVVIALAAWRLTRSAVKRVPHAIIGVAVALAALLGVNEIAALVFGGGLGMLWLRRALPKGGTVLLAAGAASGIPVTLWGVGGVFLKVGSVLYGSGYVLVAFLEEALVRDRGWLSERQLLDAIAVGQFTPGPVLSTATFIGYLLAGIPGAVIATVGIFLPSFVFVAFLQSILPRIRKGAWTAAFLDAINVAAIGLMVAVTIRLSSNLRDWREWLIVGAGSMVGIRWKPHAGWLIVGGAVVGALLF
jgi:chromate transporter